MPFTAETEQYLNESPHNELYTSFKLDLTEYSIVRHFYGELKTKFVITDTEHECHLQWKISSFHSSEWKKYVKQAAVLVEFSEDCKFDNMKIIVSIIDENGRKLVSRYAYKGNDSSMEFPMTDEDDNKVDSTIQGYLHNDTLTILCELKKTPLAHRVGTNPIDNTLIHAKYFYDSVQEKFNEFFDIGELCDVIIFAGDEKFNVHKIVLAANSQVFHAMFTMDMKEQRENTVTITDFDVDTIEAFLRYIYTGKVARNDGQVRDLLMIADKYEVVGLINLCKECMLNKLEAPIEHYRKQCPNKKEYTSFTWDLTEFDVLQKFNLITSAQFIITNTDYKCELEVSDYTYKKINVRVRFPKDCKLLLKVIISFVDQGGEKIKSKFLMKREQTDFLTFRMAQFDQVVNSLNNNLKILCELVYVDLTLIKSTAVTGELRDENLLNSKLKKFELFFNDKTFCDVTLVVKDAEIHAHKVVLAANSLIFEAMFSKNAAEQIGNTVKLDDSDATTFKAFLTFMYTGSFGKIEELIRDLLILAEKYKVFDLATLCKNYTQKYLDPANVNAIISSKFEDKKKYGDSSTQEETIEPPRESQQMSPYDWPLWP